MDLKVDNLETKLSALPSNNRTTVLEILNGQTFSGALKDLDGDPIETARQLLGLASSFSVAPLSAFHVGAIAIGNSGNFYLGANMEFLGVPLHASLHAEQSAVLNAWQHGENALSALVISEAPCGFCRQFLGELSGSDNLKIVFGHQSKTLTELLPSQFGTPRQKGTGLLDSPPLELESIAAKNSLIEILAVDAAKRSYTPYTNAPEGFVLECTDGSLFTGRTAESVAFNPTVTAVASALNQRNLSHSRHKSIYNCCQSKLATALFCQNSFATALMEKLTNTRIQTVLIEQSAD